MDKPSYRAYVCCGPNCGPKDSRRLLDFLEQEVGRQGLAEQVQVLPTGCQSHCESGPTMVVYPGPVFYQEMDIAKLERIVAEHFGSGRPVAAYCWQGENWRGTIGKKEPPAGTPAPDLPQWRRPEPSHDGKPKPKRRPTYEPDDFKW